MRSDSTCGVCAVVVTFRPDQHAIVNVATVCGQVEAVVIVDNGSEWHSLGPIRQLAQTRPIYILENGSNLGIAKALNIGVRRALELGFYWVLLLDQDSTVTDGFISRMMQDFEEQNRVRPILLMVPRYRDSMSGSEASPLLAPDGGPLVTITSGSLLPAKTFERCGFFNEDLFIYTVDDEYSLRIRSLGFSIAQSTSAVLLHSPGKPSEHRWFGFTVRTTNHSAGARYYLNRNRVWMLRTYGRRYPQWAKAILRAFVVELIKIVVAEQSRWRKVRMIMLGVRDGFANRLGQRVSL